MREIKFRVWDTKRNEFLTDFDLSFAHYGDVTISAYPNSQDYIGDECHNGEPQRGRWSIQQFTGLLDKNGKEIYEGDIIQLIDRPNYKYRVCFENCGFYCYHVNLKDFDGSALKWGGIWRFDELNYPIEIIGNIYESPELLNL